VPKLPGINHKDAIRALERAGFHVHRQSKHIIMTDAEGLRTLVIPRGNPINAYTMGVIVRDSGLTIDEFKKLL
jgi:predicted RNA binding protein YcfA (HicA-like mRNA interferase family)